MRERKIHLQGVRGGSLGVSIPEQPVVDGFGDSGPFRRRAASVVGRLLRFAAPAEIRPPQTGSIQGRGEPG